MGVDKGVDKGGRQGGRQRGRAEGAGRGGWAEGVGRGCGQRVWAEGAGKKVTLAGPLKCTAKGCAPELRWRSLPPASWCAPAWYIFSKSCMPG